MTGFRDYDLIVTNNHIFMVCGVDIGVPTVVFNYRNHDKTLAHNNLDKHLDELKEGRHFRISNKSAVGAVVRQWHNSDFCDRLLNNDCGFMEELTPVKEYTIGELEGIVGHKIAIVDSNTCESTKSKNRSFI